MNEEVILGYTTIAVIGVLLNGFFLAWLRSYRVDRGRIIKLVLMGQAIGLFSGVGFFLVFHFGKVPPLKLGPNIQGIHAAIIPGLLAWISLSAGVLKFYCSREAKIDHKRESEPLDKWRQPESQIEPPAF